MGTDVATAKSDVVFGPPPDSGAQKCGGCGGWIVSSMRYVTADGPLCPACAQTRLRPFDDAINELIEKHIQEDSGGGNIKI